MNGRLFVRLAGGALGLACVAALLHFSSSQVNALYLASTAHASYAGISFEYDTSLASAVTARTIPAERAGPQTPSWLLHPEYVEFEFTGYPAVGDWEPTISIYPVKSSYRELYLPEEPVDFWANGVDALRSLLRQKPDLGRSVDPRSGNQALPFLPTINAAQVNTWKRDYLGFSYGSGIRYLLEMAQDLAPASSQNTFYTYQGLSSDGKYYVSARFPAFLAAPPAPWDGSAGQTTDTYNLQVGAKIEQARGSEFKPNLDLLDGIVRSLRVDSRTAVSPPPATIPGMPATGSGNPKEWVIGLLLVAGVAGGLAGLALRSCSATPGSRQA
jgi:hypothetical protein